MSVRPLCPRNVRIIHGVQFGGPCQVTGPHGGGDQARPASSPSLRPSLPPSFTERPVQAQGTHSHPRVRARMGVQDSSEPSRGCGLEDMAARGGELHRGQGDPCWCVQPRVTAAREQGRIEGGRTSGLLMCVLGTAHCLVWCVLCGLVVWPGGWWRRCVCAGERRFQESSP